MGKNMSRNKRRIFVVLNFFFMIFFIVFFIRGEYTSWNLGLIMVVSISFLIFIFSIVILYGRTNLWKLTHTKTDELDEREIYITHQAFRKSYEIFGVLSLILLFFIFFTVRYSFFTLTPRGHYSLGLILLMALNYLFNIIPAAILAWTEKDI